MSFRITCSLKISLRATTIRTDNGAENVDTLNETSSIQTAGIAFSLVWLHFNIFKYSLVIISFNIICWILYPCTFSSLHYYLVFVHRCVCTSILHVILILCAYTVLTCCILWLEALWKYTDDEEACKGWYSMVLLWVEVNERLQQQQ